MIQMLLKVVSDKTARVKFKISNTFNETLIKHIQNNQKSRGKSILAVIVRDSKTLISADNLNSIFI
jgi:hypothetical protein